jgi:hypothetical protein
MARNIGIPELQVVPTQQLCETVAVGMNGFAPFQGNHVVGHDTLMYLQVAACSTVTSI